VKEIPPEKPKAAREPPTKKKEPKKPVRSLSKFRQSFRAFVREELQNQPETEQEQEEVQQKQVEKVKVIKEKGTFIDFSLNVSCSRSPQRKSSKSEPRKSFGYYRVTKEAFCKYLVERGPLCRWKICLQYFCSL
jgi:hypothetical protein